MVLAREPYLLPKNYVSIETSIIVFHQILYQKYIILIDLYFGTPIGTPYISAYTYLEIKIIGTVTDVFS